MKTKKIPAIIMLIAGSVSCIITYLNNYSLKDMLVALVWVLIIFLVIGIFVEWLFEKNGIAVEPETVEGDGEVVEKTGEENGEETVDENQVPPEGTVVESDAPMQEETEQSLS